MSLVPTGKRATAKVDNTSRKTWDKEEFRKKAEEKEKARSSYCTRKDDTEPY
jgi:hypothetical protein